MKTIFSIAILILTVTILMVVVSAIHDKMACIERFRNRTTVLCSAEAAEKMTKDFVGLCGIQRGDLSEWFDDQTLQNTACPTETIKRLFEAVFESEDINAESSTATSE